jgi:hypothetical protein
VFRGKKYYKKLMPWWLFPYKLRQPVEEKAELRYNPIHEVQQT